MQFAKCNAPRPIQTKQDTSGPRKTWGGLTLSVSRPSLRNQQKDVSASSGDSKTSSGAEKQGYPLELE